MGLDSFSLVITSGEANEILLGVRNVGEVPRTVAFVSAAFANPLNLSQVWRNVGRIL